MYFMLVGDNNIDSPKISKPKECICIANDSPNLDSSYELDKDKIQKSFRNQTCFKPSSIYKGLKSSMYHTKQPLP